MNPVNYRHSQRRVRLALYGLILLLITTAVGGALIPSPLYPETSADPAPTNAIGALTTQLGGPDLLATGISISRAVYPGAARARAVILVPEDDWRAGLVAAALTGPPVTGPILPMPAGPMPPEAVEEIERLNPRGISGDGGIQVLAVGAVDEKVLNQISKMGLRYRTIDGATPAELAARADHYRAILTGNHPDQVLLVPVDFPEYAMIAASWAAQSGHPILFVEGATLPLATRRALDLRPAEAFMYVFAPERILPRDVAEEMVFFGHVQRIPGDDPFEMATAFARYTDRGTVLPWWFGATPRIFGWGVSGAGHNFIFVNIDEPMHAVIASGLSSRGTHGPLLWIEEDHVPESTTEFLATTRPAGGPRPDPLMNRGWLIGNENSVTLTTRHQIHRNLRAIRPKEALIDDE